MNLEQMKDNLNKSWNKSLLQIGISLVAIIFVLEILILGIYYSGNLLDGFLVKYIIRMVCLPTIIHVLIAYFMYRIYRCESVAWITKGKETILCYSLFVMLAISAYIFRTFHVLWIAPCVCQYLHSVYASRKGVMRIQIVNNLFIVLITYSAIKDKAYTWDYLAMTAVCALGMMYIIFLVAKLLLGFHAEQVEYMQENFNRQEELIRELKIEPMTGLYNRYALPEKINLIVEANSKKQQESYLAMLDLDHFKNVNDTYGHVSGDLVICQAANLIKKHMHADVEGFRFGGEEFTLVFRDKTKENVLSILEQIRREMEESRFEFDSKFKITMSIGVAAFKPGMDWEMWMDQADGALYDCKNNGRNQMKLVS